MPAAYQQALTSRDLARLNLARTQVTARSTGSSPMSGYARETTSTPAPRAGAARLRVPSTSPDISRRPTLAARHGDGPRAPPNLPGGTLTRPAGGSRSLHIHLATPVAGSSQPPVAECVTRRITRLRVVRALEVVR